ncbi:MAG: RHS repeat-associated core domain-containing protein [Chitinophagales bacterium]|nr:RHS repeat-associated core domain-containing protein [Chitinophagales bacterium]
MRPFIAFKFVIFFNRKHSLIRLCGLFVGVLAFTQLSGQIAGGRANTESSPHTIEPSTPAGEAYSGDVNLFTGTYSSSYQIGSVSTPGGLRFSLQLEHNSIYTGGNTLPLASGIPYGEGWSLNIPTISISTEAYRAYTQSDYCLFQNNPTNTGNLAKSEYDGDAFWHSPTVSIPGVAGGRLVFKYLKDGDAVFVPNAFEEYFEARLRGETWRVILKDGTTYEFNTVKSSYRTPNNRRVLTDVGAYENTPTIGQAGNFNLSNSVIPKAEPLVWYCTSIYNPNQPGWQTIEFIYRTFGAFDFFKEYSPDAQYLVASGLAKIQNSNHFLPNFRVFTEVLLDEVYSADYYCLIEQVKLNYATEHPSGTKNMLNIGAPGVKRLDSLFSFKSVYYQGIYNTQNCTGGPAGGGLDQSYNYLPDACTQFSFSGWKRFYHLKHSAVQQHYSNSSITSTNPYRGTINGLGSMLFKTAYPTIPGYLEFDHGYLESARISGPERLIPGDIYEIRTVVSGNSFCNLDINLATGPNSIINWATEPSGFKRPSLSTIYPTIKETVFTTFNQAVKWNVLGSRRVLNQSNGPLVTSNFFSMPNLPEAFGGFHIQIGPANSDNDFSKIADQDMISYDMFSAHKSYASLLPAPELVLNNDAPTPGNFGVGLPWHQMLPVYRELDEPLIYAVDNSTNNTNRPATRFQFWWHAFESSNYSNNQPTLAKGGAGGVKLNAVELIRYSKNPYMLKSVDTYHLNGEYDSKQNPGLVLTHRVLITYSLQTEKLIDNRVYQPNQPPVMSQNKWHNLFLLSEIKEIPVNPSQDNPPILSTDDLSKAPTTFFSYTLAQPSAINDELRTNGSGILLTKITMPAGKIKEIEYNPLGANSVTSRYNGAWQCLNVTNSAMPPSSVIQISHTVKTIKVHDDDGYQQRDYQYDPGSIRVKREYSVLNPDHFDNRSVEWKYGYQKTTVTEPELAPGVRPYTVYYHLDTDKFQGTTIDHQLLFGKLKKIEKFNATGVLLSSVENEFEAAPAFVNGIFRDANFEAYKYGPFFPNLDHCDYQDFIDQIAPDFQPPNPVELKVLSSIYENPYFLEGSALSLGSYSYYNTDLNSFFVKKNREIRTHYDLVEGGSNRAKVETITNFEYFDAEPDGKTASIGLKKIHGLSLVNNPGKIQLNFEPSWQIYRKRTYSPQNPQTFQEEESFYYFDLLNRYSPNSSVQRAWRPLVNSYNGSDLFVFTVLEKAYEWGLRHLPFEQCIVSKSASLPAVSRSTYYLYDCDWPLNLLSITSDVVDPTVTCSGGFGDNGLDPQECVELVHQENNIPNIPIPLWHAIIQLTEVQNKIFVCPVGSWNTNDPTISVLRSNPPVFSENGPNNGRVDAAWAFRNKAQLRSVYMQIDTVFQPDTYQSHFIEANDYKPLMDFRFIPEQGTIAARWIPVFPYDVLKTDSIYERNLYGQPVLEEDASGLRTRYFYAPKVMTTYRFPNCTIQNYNSVTSRNIGLPDSVVVGSGLSDSLVTAFRYYIDNSVKNVVDPNQMVMHYTYDDFGRLHETFRNGIRLTKNAYHLWENNFNQDFAQRAAENYQESFIFNQDNSPAAERIRTYFDPLGRTYNTAVQDCPNADAGTLSRTMVHSGEIVYDKWNRVAKTFKPFVHSGRALVSFQPRLRTTNSSLYPDIAGSTRYENDWHTRPLEYAHPGEALGGAHNAGSSYSLMDGLAVKNLLGLSAAETADIMPGTVTDYVFQCVHRFDEDGKVVQEIINASGQKVAEWRGTITDNAVTLFVYDSYGNLTKVINPLKQIARYHYNMLGWMYQRESADAGIARYLYDRMGRIVLEQDAALAPGSLSTDDNNPPQFRRYTYDDFGRMIRQERITLKQPGNFSYGGNLLVHPMTYTDIEEGSPTGTGAYYDYRFTNASTYSWKARIKIKQSVHPQFQTVSYTQLQLTDFLSYPRIEKQWWYDGDFSVNAGFESYPPASLIHPKALEVLDPSYSGQNADSRRRTFTKGRLSHLAVYNHDAMELSDIQQTPVILDYFSYNEDGEVKIKIQQLNPMGISPADKGKLALATQGFNCRGLVTYQELSLFDENNQVMLGVSDHSVINLHDYRGRIVGVNHNSGNEKLVEYQYDDATELRLKTTYWADAASSCSPSRNEKVGVLKYAYDLRNRLVSMESPFFDYQLFYDQNLVNYNNVPLATQTSYNGNLNGTVATYKPGFGAVIPHFGLPTYMGFSYDPLNRLTSANTTVGDFVSLQQGNKIGDESYQYDKIGNFTQLIRFGRNQLSGQQEGWNFQYTPGTNRLNQVAGINATPNRIYQYDPNGNLILDSYRGISNSAYGRTNLPFQLEKTGNIKVNYLYDSEDQRIFKEIRQNSVVTQWEYCLRDPSGKEWAVLTFNNGQTYVDHYYYGLERFARYRRPIAANSSTSSNVYFIYDHLGNTRVAYSAKGKCLNTTYAGMVYTIENMIDYFPYGKILRQYSNAQPERFLTTFNERDPETGWDYRMARWYDGDIGRFLGVDPMEEETMPNWSGFAYANNSPANFSDPKGALPDDGNYGNPTFNKREGYYELKEVQIIEYRDLINPVDHFNKGIFPTTLPDLGTISAKKENFFEKWENANWTESSFIKLITTLSYNTADDLFILGQVNPISKTFFGIDNPRHLTGRIASSKETVEGSMFGMTFFFPETSAVKIAKPLNAAQFSSMFKGTLSKLSSKNRGFINRNINKIIIENINKQTKSGATIEHTKEFLRTKDR